MIDNVDIEQFLRSHELHFLRDDNGGFVLPFVNDKGNTIMVSFLIEGEGNVFAARGWDPRTVPVDNWPRLFAIVNSFHAEFRWPRGHVEPGPEALGILAAEYQVPCTALDSAVELETHAALALDTISAFFAFVDDAFPTYARKEDLAA